MRGPFDAWIDARLVAAGLLALAAAAQGRAQRPPEEATAALVPADGLAVALFAAEPLLANPSNIDVDARGRVWVCEVMNYRGRQNTRPAGDRILVLEDTDGDGRADRQTVFHQGRDVDSALGICVIGEGPGRRAIVSCAPEVFVLHDDDGDLVADRKEVLFTATGMPQHDHSVHAFTVGPDGRWYFNVGNTGRAVHDRDGRPVTDRFGNVVNDSGRPWRQGMVFRCRPDGGDFEVLAHNFRNPFEVAVDAYGWLWQSDNDDDGRRGVRINQVMDFGNHGYVDERTGAGWRTSRTNQEERVPLRHWHQNDPGVVPNLLLTGAGSPTGICVFEGDLLPARFRGGLIHCDAGPNVVRAYHVRPDGAGFAAEVEIVVDGSADQWFRPSDVCVAPDGSLVVADWYDPGVGGHGMGDIDRGRIFRVAPAGSAWSVPPADFDSIVGAVAAVVSPNHCTRATALERLAADPEAAHAALEAAFTAADPVVDPWRRARLAWAAGMLPGRAGAWIARLVADDEAMLRIVAVRMCRLVHPGREGADREALLAVVERLVADPSPLVRREAAIALRGIAGSRADEAWAALAAQAASASDGPDSPARHGLDSPARHGLDSPARHGLDSDRWAIEALGIGADGGQGLVGPSNWDGRLAAWQARVGDDWNAPAGRAVVWRSRAAATPALICRLIADPEVSTSESLALLRALDFQDPAAVATAVRDLVATFTASDEKLQAVLPELAVRLDGSAAVEAGLAGRIDEAVDYVAGTSLFVELVSRHRLERRLGDLVALAAAESTADQLATKAAAVALETGGQDAIRSLLAAAVRGRESDRDAGHVNPPEMAAAERLLLAVGGDGAAAARTLLRSVMLDAAAPPELAAAAVRGLVRTEPGTRQLVEAAAGGELPRPLAPVAGLAVASCPWNSVKEAAAGVLPLPQARGGTPLPPVAELAKRQGRPDAGRSVFAGSGTCGKCHVVGDTGREVGPNLSGIGAKLARPALYEAILAPSAAISHNYETWTAILADGRAVTGLLLSRSDAEAVIRTADGGDTVIPAGGLEELVRQPVSLMPADLATALSAEELVDLVAYLETLRAAD